MAFWNDPSSIVPKRQYTWVVYFGSKTLDKTTVETVGENRLFVGFFKTVSKPSYTLKTTQHKYLGLHEFHYPTHVVWQPVKMTLVDGYIYDVGGNYIRNDEFVWDNGTLAYKGRQLVKRSAQMFFHDALRESGYTDPEEFDANQTLARFRRTPFKNDLVTSVVGKNPDFINNGAVDTRKWNTLDIVEYSPVITPYSTIDYLKNNNSTATTGTGNNKETPAQRFQRISKDINAANSLNQETGVKEMERWELYNPIITDVSYGELNYDQDGINNITLTVVYDWAKLTVNGTNIQGPENIKKATTQDISINTKLGQTQATVRRSDIDEITAQAVAKGSTIPSVQPNTVQQVQQAVKNAEVYGTKVQAVDIINPDNSLNNAILTTKDQLQAEFKDIDTVVTDTQEARNALADVLTARSVGAEAGAKTSDIEAIVRDRIASDSSLSAEEKGKISLLPVQYTSKQLSQNDTGFKNAIDFTVAEQQQAAESALQGIQVAQDQKNDDIFSKQRERIKSDSSLSATERVAKLAGYDQKRSEIVTDRAINAINTSNFDTSNAAEQNISLLKQQIVKLYGDQGLDITKLDSAIEQKRQENFSSSVTRIEDLNRRIVEAGDNAALVANLEKERKSIVTLAEQYGSNKDFISDAVELKKSSTPTVRASSLIPNTTLDTSEEIAVQKMEEDVSETTRRLDLAIRASYDRIADSIPTLKDTEAEQRQLSELNLSINKSYEWLRALPDSSTLTDEQLSARSRSVQSLTKNLQTLLETKSELEKQYQQDTKYNDEARARFDNYASRQQEIIEKAKTTKARQEQALRERQKKLLE